MEQWKNTLNSLGGTLNVTRLWVLGNGNIAGNERVGGLPKQGSALDSLSAKVKDGVFSRYLAAPTSDGEDSPSAKWNEIIKVSFKSSISKCVVHIVLKGVAL